MRNAGRKGRKLGAYGRKKLLASQPVGFCCGTRPEKEIRRNAVKVLKNAGRGRIWITASDAHLIEMIVSTADSEHPEHCDLYGSKNGNTAELLKRIRGQSCKACGGNGWWPSDMGEGADFCPECKGTGAQKTSAGGPTK